MTLTRCRASRWFLAVMLLLAVSLSLVIGQQQEEHQEEEDEENENRWIRIPPKTATTTTTTTTTTMSQLEQHQKPNPAHFEEKEASTGSMKRNVIVVPSQPKDKLQSAETWTKDATADDVDDDDAVDDDMTVHCRSSQRPGADKEDKFRVLCHWEMTSKQTTRTSTRAQVCRTDNKDCYQVQLVVEPLTEVDKDTNEKKKEEEDPGEEEFATQFKLPSETTISTTTSATATSTTAVLGTVAHTLADDKDGAHTNHEELNANDKENSPLTQDEMNRDAQEKTTRNTYENTGTDHHTKETENAKQTNVKSSTSTSSKSRETTASANSPPKVQSSLLSQAQFSLEQAFFQMTKWEQEQEPLHAFSPQQEAKHYSQVERHLQLVWELLKQCRNEQTERNQQNIWFVWHIRQGQAHWLAAELRHRWEGGGVGEGEGMTENENDESEMWLEALHHYQSAEEAFRLALAKLKEGEEDDDKADTQQDREEVNEVEWNLATLRATVATVLMELYAAGITEDGIHVMEEAQPPGVVSFDENPFHHPQDDDVDGNNGNGAQEENDALSQMLFKAASYLEQAADVYRRHWKRDFPQRMHRHHHNWNSISFDALALSDILNMLGQTYWYRNDLAQTLALWDEAAAYYQQSLEKNKEEEEEWVETTQAFADLLQSKSTAHLYMQEYHKATTAFSESISLYQKLYGKEPPMGLGGADGLGGRHAHLQWGDTSAGDGANENDNVVDWMALYGVPFDEVVAMHEDALAQYYRALRNGAVETPHGFYEGDAYYMDPDDAYEAQLLASLGSVYYMASQWELARVNFHRAIELYRNSAHDDEEALAEVLWKTALVHLALGEYPESLSAFEKTVECYQRMGGIPGYRDWDNDSYLEEEEELYQMDVDAMFPGISRRGGVRNTVVTRHSKQDKDKEKKKKTANKGDEDEEEGEEPKRSPSRKRSVTLDLEDYHLDIFGNLTFVG